MARKRQLGYHDEVAAQIQAKLPADVQITYDCQTRKSRRRGEEGAQHRYVVSRQATQLALLVETARNRGSHELRCLELKESLYYNYSTYFRYAGPDTLDTFVVELRRILDVLDKASATLDTVLAQLCQDDQFDECKVSNKGRYPLSSTTVGLSFAFGNELSVWGDAFVVYPQENLPKLSGWGLENEMKVYVRFDGNVIQISSGELVGFKDIRTYIKRYATDAMPKYLHERARRRNVEASAKLVVQLNQDIENLRGVSVDHSDDANKVRLRIDALCTPNQVRALAAALKQVQE